MRNLMQPAPAKRVTDSQVELNFFMMIEHANLYGNVHGGVIMKLVDEAGALCAMRHAQRPTVTVAIDSVTFLSPVQVGNVLNLKACLTFVGRSSMEVGVKVIAEDPLTGQKTHTNSAYAVYVALSNDGRPVFVPRLLLETELEQQRWNEGERRQKRRLSGEA